MIELRLDWKALAFGILLYLVLNDETFDRVKKNTPDSKIIFGSDRTEYIQSHVDNDLQSLCDDIYNPNNKPEVIYERPQLRFSSR